MPTYRYESKTAAGKVNSGVLQAADLAGASAQLLRSELSRGVASAVRLSTSDPRFGGPGAAHLAPDYAFSGAGAALDLPPHSAVLLRSTASTTPPVPPARGGR